MPEKSAPRMTFDRSVFTILLALVIVAAMLFAVGLNALRTPLLQVNEARPPAQNTVTNENLDQRLRAAEQKYEEIRVKLEYAEKQSDRIQRLVAALVSVASILAAALGVTAYYNLKQTLENGKEELARMKEFRETVRAQFPALENMDHALASILTSSLAVLNLRTEDWRKKLFTGLDDTQKQRVALAEIQAGSFDFFSLRKVSAYSKQASEVYQRLGRFYGSKYSVARHKKWALGDLHRSIVYFETALTYAEESTPRRAEIRSDLGYMRLEVSYLQPDALQQKALRQDAKRRFDESLTDRADLPSALLGLAWIEKRDDSPRQAEKTLDKLIESADVADPESVRFLHKAYFNRACYRAIQERDQPPGTHDLSKVLTDLKSAKALLAELPEEDYWKEWIEDLNRESGSTGDLDALPPQEVAGLKERLSDRKGIVDHKELSLKEIIAQLGKKLSPQKLAASLARKSSKPPGV